MKFAFSDRRAELKRMEEQSKMAMSKEHDKKQSLMGDLPAGTVSKVLIKQDKGSNGDNMSNSMCGGTAFEETNTVGSKLGFSKEQVSAA